MLRRLYAIAAEGTDPYENLALEAYLLERVQPGECILYLWQNQGLPASRWPRAWQWASAPWR